MSHLTVTPAYGRDYTSEEAVLKDWHDYKDWIVATLSDPYCGAYINKEDAESSPHAEINIRYSKNRKVVVVKVR